MRVHTFLWPCVLVILFTVSCSKKDTVKNTSSQIQIINASPNSGSLSVLQNLKSLGNFSYLTGFNAGAANYITVDSGFNNYRVKKGTDILQTSLYSNVDNHFSYFVFDSSVTGKIKSFFLQDKTDSTGSGNRSSIRLVHVSPGLDTVYLLTPAVTNGTDSAFIGSPYFGNYSAETIYQSVRYQYFLSGVRTIRIYRNSDRQVLRNYTFNFEKGRIYSLILKGYDGRAGADSLSLSIIRHN